MSAQLFILRPFQSARRVARQAGMNDGDTIQRIRDAQRNGHEGNQIVGELRIRAWATRNGYSNEPNGPKGAA